MSNQALKDKKDLETYNEVYENRKWMKKWSKITKNMINVFEKRSKCDKYEVIKVDFKNKKRV